MGAELLAWLALLLYLPRRWLPYVAAALFMFSYTYSTEPEYDHRIQGIPPAHEA